MSHNIMNNNAFAGTKPAWHKLGTVVDKAMTAKEALELAHLDYEVKQSKVKFYNEATGNIEILEDRVVNYNGNTGSPFGVVSNTYKLIQNTEALSFFDSIVGEGEAIFETAGALNNGNIAFISAKLPDYIRVEGTDDITSKYLLLSIGHDGKHPTQAMFTPVRVVCNNTLSSALRNSKNKVTIYHKGDTKDKLKEAHKVLGIANKLTEELSQIYTQMSKVKIDDKEAINTIRKQFLTYEEITDLNKGAYLRDVVSTRKYNTLKGIERFLFTGVGQDMDTCKGTVYGMFNAVNGYYSNKKESNLDKKVTSLYFGQKASIIDNMFKASLELI